MARIFTLNGKCFVEFNEQVLVDNVILIIELNIVNFLELLCIFNSNHSKRFYLEFIQFSLRSNLE